jgi:hypothetical protein
VFNETAQRWRLNQSPTLWAIDASNGPVSPAKASPKRPLAGRLARVSSLPCVLQNDTASMTIGDSPFLNLIQGTKAAEANSVIVQAAISFAGGLSGIIDITHCVAQLPCFEFEHTCDGGSR